MARIYMASKTHWADRWEQLKDMYSEHTFRSRWPSLIKTYNSESRDDAKWFWRVDFNDVLHSDCVVVYAEEGEHLRGALVEAGLALGIGLTVIVVGEHPDYGTWQFHPGVIKAADLPEAMTIAGHLFGEARG